MAASSVELATIVEGEAKWQLIPVASTDVDGTIDVSGKELTVGSSPDSDVRLSTADTGTRFCTRTCGSGVLGPRLTVRSRMSALLRRRADQSIMIALRIIFSIALRSNRR